MVWFASISLRSKELSSMSRFGRLEYFSLNILRRPRMTRVRSENIKECSYVGTAVDLSTAIAYSYWYTIH